MTQAKAKTITEMQEVTPVADKTADVPAGTLQLFLAGLHSGKKGRYELVPEYEFCSPEMKAKIDAIVAAYNPDDKEASLNFGGEPLKRFESLTQEITQGKSADYADQILDPVIEGIDSVNTEDISSLGEFILKFKSRVKGIGSKKRGWLTGIFSRKTPEEIEAEERTKCNHEMEIIEAKLRNEAVSFNKCQYKLQMARANIPWLEKYAVEMEANRDGILSDMIAYMIAGGKITKKLVEQGEVARKSGKAFELGEIIRQVTNMDTQNNTLLQSAVTLAIHGYKGVEDVKQNIADIKLGLENLATGMTFMEAQFKQAGAALTLYSNCNIISQFDARAAGNEARALNSVDALKQQLESGRMSEEDFDKAIAELQKMGKKLEVSRAEIEGMKQRVKEAGEENRAVVLDLVRREIKHETGIDVDAQLVEARRLGKQAEEVLTQASAKPAKGKGSTNSPGPG